MADTDSDDCVRRFRGQRLPPLLKYFQSVLRRYPDGGQILKLGFAGESRMEKAMVDCLASSLTEVLDSIARIHYLEKDTAQAEEMKKKAFEETFPRIFSYAETILKANNNGQGFLVGSKISIADIITQHVLSIVGLSAVGGAQLLQQYPALIELKKRVEAEPYLRAYFQKRRAAKQALKEAAEAEGASSC